MSVRASGTIARATGQAAPLKPKRPELSRRARVLWEIAERYDELVDPLNSGEGVRGTGECVPLMPPTYTATVREFERLLGVMRNRAKQEAFRGRSVGTLRWHVVEFLLKPERVVKLETVRVLKGRRRVELRHPDGSLVMRPVVGYTRRDPGARRERAEDGIEWMAAHWGLRVEPELWVDPELRRRGESPVTAAA